MLGNAAQHPVEIEFWVESVELCGAEQRVDRGSAPAAGIGSAEEVILPSQRNGSKRSLSCRVVDLQQTVIDVACEGAPVGKRIADRARSFALGGQEAEHLFHPAFEIVEQGLGARLANRAAQRGGLATGFGSWCAWAECRSSLPCGLLLC